jgi:phage shock protein C
MNHLTRSRTSRMVSGVIGGIAEYYAVEPVLPRLAFIFFLMLTGVFPGVILYLIAVVMMPKADDVQPR